MICEICGNNDVNVIYDDFIRDGAPGTLTKVKYKMYQCQKCKTIWHEHDSVENEVFYQSISYREKLEGTADLNDYYRFHDFEVLEKMNYCGTTIFRGKNVADIGCGGGGFLDFLSGVAAEIIAIEPSVEYRKSLADRNFHTYAYAKDAKNDWFGKLSVVTSFDVIEHADNPVDFMRDVYELLENGGKGVIGTPTDCPVMRGLLGKIYEQGLLYSYQHNWILSIDGLKKCCEKAGFKNIIIKSVQRYGLSNMIAWLKEKKPAGHLRYDFVTDILDKTYKNEIERIGKGDYILAYVDK